MLLIKPSLDQSVACPHCQTPLAAEKLLWQGIHVCGIATCQTCASEIISDLPVGHGAIAPYQVDLARGELYRDRALDRDYTSWLGQPLLASLQQPCTDPLTITKEQFQVHRRVILLNCLDYLYGHCLLKLLNASRHLQQHPDLGLIVIVPAFLRWLVPDGVAEIWVVHQSLRQGQAYYPEFDRFVQQECERFDQIYLSRADSHPSQFDITDFSGVAKHEFDPANLTVTYIWRQDRPWCHPWLLKVLRRLNLFFLTLWIQNWQVRQLFAGLRRQGFTGKLAIAGLGTRTRFPDWIQDQRVEKFTPEAERQLCQLYADSRIVIGVHGSNLLLPSAHAGMTIDLMPLDRWPNLAQDILYQEPDPRMASFRYRFLPVQTSAGQVAQIARTMVDAYQFCHQELRSHVQ